MTPDSDVDTDSSTPDTTMPEPRYQLRARTPSAASSATSSDETDADGEKILRKSVSKKSGLRRPLGQKPSSGKLSSAGHTDPSPCYVNFHEEPPTLTADTSASNFNPIFLRMSCWRDENPDTVSFYCIDYYIFLGIVGTLEPSNSGTRFVRPQASQEFTNGKLYRHFYYF